ncbi:MAG: hypothetical protein JO202_14445 [Ktedonobacteraceae bacterium]|nr:hypothetical protein [Ktedonobacteraceae bacterium]
MSYKSRPRKKERPCLSMDDLLALVAENKNGQPNYGVILKYFRMQMGWKGWELAQFYSEALGAEGLEEETKLVTKQWIYMMENQNMVPVDQKRRRILAKLLDIPPVLFGLEALPSPSSAFTWEAVDVVEYRATLVQYCVLLHLGIVQPSLEDIKRRISNLHREAPFANPVEKKDLFALLCGYYLLAGDIAHDQMCFDEAIGLHGRAITIAKENTLYDVWAFALLERGDAYLERGGITVSLKGLAAAQADFEAAVRDMQAARQLEAKISPHYKAIISLRAGATEAHLARDRQELLKALKVIDLATGEIDKPATEEGLAIKLDQERYHLDRARAYLASPFQMARFPASAREELEAATRLTEPTHKVRQTDNAILLAQSYLVEEYYPLAATYAENALDLVKGIGSRLRLASIEALYRELRGSRYGKHPDVAKLGIKLLRVQQPQMFN